MVKVLAIEGNKIRLSRKAVLRDQKPKQDARPEGVTESSEPQVESQP
jgi:hypothetical protein